MTFKSFFRTVFSDLNFSFIEVQNIDCPAFERQAGKMLVMDGNLVKGNCPEFRKALIARSPSIENLLKRN